MRSHPVFARVYARLSAKLDEAGNAEHRQELLAGLSGVVCEVGAGNGLNFAHYPPCVDRVVAVEPEPYLRRAAERAAADARVPVTVVSGTAESLPLDDDAVDAVVLSLVLCSVGDVPAALDEVRRVLRPGGTVRFYEHVLAEEPGTARRQRAIDRVWPHVAGGCHTSRDTLTALRVAGFDVQQVRRFVFGPSWAPTAPHVLGTARRS